MAGLKELRGRIEAIKSTEKITSAMKMVSAARLRHAQDLLIKSSSYKDNLYNCIGRILCSMRRDMLESQASFELPDICHGRGKEERFLLVVFSSDRGLCGSYNASIARATTKRVEELRAKGREVKLVCFGQKAYNLLRHNYADIIIAHTVSVVNNGVNYSEAVELLDMIQKMFAKDELDVCEIVYSHSYSALRRDVISKQVFPFMLELLYDKLPQDFVDGAYYETEPSRNVLIEELVPLAWREFVFDIMTNSQTSEQGARMASMDNATRNAQDMIAKLALKYNRLRQSSITTELVEIIAGAEAI